MFYGWESCVTGVDELNGYGRRVIFGYIWGYIFLVPGVIRTKALVRKTSVGSLGLDSTFVLPMLDMCGLCDLCFTDVGHV